MSMFCKGAVRVVAIRVVVLEAETKAEDDGAEDQPKPTGVNVPAAQPNDDARSGNSRQDKQSQYHEFEDV